MSADPGCGKSVLALFLVDELEDRQSEPSATVCYFFFKGDNEEQRRAEFALSALLHQLFTAKPSLIRHATKDFESEGDNFTEDIGTLWRIFTSATADPDCGDVIIIFDGLDECEVSTREKLIDSLALSYAVSANRTIPTTRDTSLKFLLTSRSCGSIERRFRGLPIIRLRAEAETLAIGADIELIVNSVAEELRHMCGLTELERARLRDHLVQDADGTCLWLSLAIEKPSDYGESPLKDVLRILNTPSNMDAVTDVRSHKLWSTWCNRGTGTLESASYLCIPSARPSVPCSKNIGQQSSGFLC